MFLAYTDLLHALASYLLQHLTLQNFKIDNLVLLTPAEDALDNAYGWQCPIAQKSAIHLGIRKSVCRINPWAGQMMTEHFKMIRLIMNSWKSVEKVI